MTKAIAAQHREVGPSAIVDRRFVVKREIARGAMGVVVEAQHRTLGTTFAIKTLTEHAQSWPGGQPRLMREGRALARCVHPNIVGVVDAAVCDVHGPFLALEMLQGRSLASLLLARGRLTVAQTIRITEQLGAAVHHAHRMGVLHRDLKPANVIVGRETNEAEDRLKLVDFGIATIPEEHDVARHKLTAIGETLGTPEYMAPEHLVDSVPATALSDVYSLGVVLYECLVGDVPYAGRPGVIFTSMISGIEPPPITGVRNDVPRKLEAAVLSALARDPAARPASIAELVQACLAAVSDEPAPLDLRGPDLMGRAVVRVPYVAPVRLLDGTGNSDGRTEDISEGGLLLVADRAVDEGRSLQVKLPLPSSGRVATIDAVVRWCRGQRGRTAVGLAFSAPTPEVVDDIRQYTRYMTSARDARARTDWGGAQRRS